MNIELDCLAVDARGRFWVVEVRGRRANGWRAVETLSQEKIRRLERATEALSFRLRVTVFLALLEVTGHPEVPDTLKFNWVPWD